MKDTQLYSQILGIDKPWKVVEVRVSLASDEVQVVVADTAMRGDDLDQADPKLESRLISTGDIL